MKTPNQAHSDNALENHPDDRHAPEPAAQPDKLGGKGGRGRTELHPGGATDAEQMLDQAKLGRDGKPPVAKP